jgi:hypothetical protein
LTNSDKLDVAILIVNKDEKSNKVMFYFLVNFVIVKTPLLGQARHPIGVENTCIAVSSHGL